MSSVTRKHPVWSVLDQQQETRLILITSFQNYTHNQTLLNSLVLISATIGILIFVLDVALHFVYMVPCGRKSVLCVKSVCSITSDVKVEIERVYWMPFRLKVIVNLRLYFE